MKHKQTDHFIVLDSCRGVCACFVAIMHFMANSHFRMVPLVTSAGFFVDFFFVLSGFVIFANYEDRLRKGFGFFKFMFLRFGRLYPLHFVTLVAFVAVDVLQIIMPTLQSFATYAPFSLPGERPSDIVSNLFLFQALDLEKAKGFNAPSWSISAEFYTYVVFAIAIISFKKTIGQFCAVTAILLLVVLISGDLNSSSYMVISGFIRCLCGFSIGALCWFVWKKYNTKISEKITSRVYWNLAEILILIAIYCFVDLAKGAVDQVSAVLCGAALLVFTFENGLVSTLLRNRIFKFLGLLSYSIYMVHVFIAAKIFPVLATLIENNLDINLFTVVNGNEKLGVELWHGDILTVIYMSVVIAASYISYKLIEDPGRRLSRKIVSKKHSKRHKSDTDTVTS